MSDPATQRFERNERNDALRHPGAAMSLAPALQQDSIAARVVSMPCVEWFAEQDDSYQEEASA